METSKERLSITARPFDLQRFNAVVRPRAEQEMDRLLEPLLRDAYQLQGFIRGMGRCERVDFAKEALARRKLVAEAERYGEA